MAGIVKPKHVIVISGDPKYREYQSAPDSTINLGDLDYVADENTINTGTGPNETIPRQCTTLE